MSALLLAIYSSKPTKKGKYPIFLCIYAHGKRGYIKTEYELDDASQWYRGKVVARADAAMMNKRLLYLLKKHKEQLSYIDNCDCYRLSR